jgi:N-acetyl-anhydromuramyl-L-alanine amidase AmpD
VPSAPNADVVTPLGRCCSERRRAGSPIDAIVLHSTESADEPGLGDLHRVARLLERSERGVHVANDLEGNSSRVVADARMAYHATYWNATTLGIEQIGFAKFSRADWLASEAQLESTARWIAHWARRYRIPIRRCAVAGIRYNRRKRVVAGQIVRRGICSHGELDPRNRSDPGSRYPWAEVLARVRAIARAAGGK